MNLSETFFHLSQQLLYGFMGILGIGFLIGFHELGHFLFAKLFHVDTPSFSIGFGPRLISKKIGDTEFSLSAIPLGGYVEVSGMAEVGQGEQKEAQNAGPTSFASKAYYQKMLILFGGILFNILFAYISLSLLFMIGMPKNDLLRPLGIVEELPTIAHVRKDSAAERFGLQPGDKILALNHEQINDNVSAFTKAIRDLGGQPIDLTIERQGVEETITITPDSLDQPNKTQPVGSLGISFELKDVPSFGFFGAIAQGIKATNTYISLIFQSFKNMFTKRDIAGVGGPVMVIAETIKGAQKGFMIFLLFLAVISINLAVLNLIPLPILDGGQILFVTIEALIGRQLPKLREYIHMISWVLILCLVVYLTLKDIGLLKFLGFGQ